LNPVADIIYIRHLNELKKPVCSGGKIFKSPKESFLISLNITGFALRRNFPETFQGIPDK